MHDVLSACMRPELLALGALLGLQDEREPQRVTKGHFVAARPGKSGTPFAMLSDEAMRDEVEHDISTAGDHTWRNMLRRGAGATYLQILDRVERHLGLECHPRGAIEAREARIAGCALQRTLAQLSDADRAALLSTLEKITVDCGKRFWMEGGFLAALTASQASGFGVYLAASTVIGGITQVLGVALPFAFYTTMSTVIAVAIGPLGWTALGLAAAHKTGAPNLRKLMLAVLFVAAKRAAHANNVPFILPRPVG